MLIVFLACGFGIYARLSALFDVLFVKWKEQVSLLHALSVCTQ